jgi:hypothetical protein
MATAPRRAGKLGRGRHSSDVRGARGSAALAAALFAIRVEKIFPKFDGLLA